MTNKEINKIKIEIAKSEKKKYYYKRIGKCNPNKCGGACCRYVLANMFEDSYHTKITNWVRQPMQTVKYGKTTYVVSAFHCPDIMISGRCRLHGTKRQSEICDKFPMNHDDAVYKYVKEICCYTFEKTLIE